MVQRRWAVRGEGKSLSILYFANHLIIFNTLEGFDTVHEDFPHTHTWKTISQLEFSRFMTSRTLHAVISYFKACIASNTAWRCHLSLLNAWLHDLRSKSFKSRAKKFTWHESYSCQSLKPTFSRIFSISVCCSKRKQLTTTTAVNRSFLRSRHL